jgi:hypothetical protein
MDKFQVAFKEVMSNSATASLHAQDPATVAALGYRDLPPNFARRFPDLS